MRNIRRLLVLGIAVLATEHSAAASAEEAPAAEMAKERQGEGEARPPVSTAAGEGETPSGARDVRGTR